MLTKVPSTSFTATRRIVTTNDEASHGSEDTISSMAQAYAATKSRNMLDLLVSIALDEQLQPNARIRAAEIVLERGLGRVSQTTSTTVTEQTIKSKFSDALEEANALRDRLKGPDDGSEDD